MGTATPHTHLQSHYTISSQFWVTALLLILISVQFILAILGRTLSWKLTYNPTHSLVPTSSLPRTTGHPLPFIQVTSVKDITGRCRRDVSTITLESSDVPTILVSTVRLRSIKETNNCLEALLELDITFASSPLFFKSHPLPCLISPPLAPSPLTYPSKQGVLATGTMRNVASSRPEETERRASSSAASRYNVIWWSTRDEFDKFVKKWLVEWAQVC